MASTAIDYDAVVQGAQQVRAARQRLDQKLQQMKNMVDNLISSEFKTDVASGKLGEVHTRFTNAATRSVETLERVGQYLEQVKREYEQEDQQASSRFGGIGGF